MGRVGLFIGLLCVALAGPIRADDLQTSKPEKDGTAAATAPMWPPFFVQTYQPEEERALLVVKAFCGTGGKGQVIASLFDSATGFPRTPVHRLYIPVDENGIAEIHFKNLVPGDYAVTVVHDADMNGRLNRNFLGVPKERYGISNDVRPGLSSPKWEEAKFPVTPPRTEISIRMARYELMASRKRDRAYREGAASAPLSSRSSRN